MRRPPATAPSRSPQQDYINRVNRAYREVEDDNVALAEDLLHGCPPERRGWEWHFVKRLCNLERLTLVAGRPSVNAIAFSPDGAWIAVGSGEPIAGHSGWIPMKSGGRPA